MEELHLTQAEIDEICEPLTQPSAQCRYLKGLGLLVKTKRNGRALVARSEWLRVMTTRDASDNPGMDAQTGPDVQAYLKLINGRKNGKEAQGRLPGPA